MAFNFGEITDFLKLASDMTNSYITCIEVKPVRMKDNVFISGFRRHSLGIIDFHLKEIKYTRLNADGYTMDIPQDADNEMWVRGDMLSDDTIRAAFNEIRNQFFKLKSFTIAELTYREKTANKSDYVMTEENIIYESKAQACKETIKKRKHCLNFKTKFVNWSEHTSNMDNMTDEEFAAAAMA